MSVNPQNTAGNATQMRIAELLESLKSPVLLNVSGGLEVYAPADGSLLGAIAQDDKNTVNQKVEKAEQAQKTFALLGRSARESLLKKLSKVIAEHAEDLARIIMLEAGKTVPEGLGEANGSAATLTKTIADASLGDFSGMQRCKERPPIGVVGLITSFNFPLVVANWTIAPALLAANAVVWKPSEKTPLTALAYKALFDQAMGVHADLLQVVVGGRDVGEALVAHETVKMLSATGSVAMGYAIHAALSQKASEKFEPILELGGNNGVIISEQATGDHREFALDGILQSFLGTAGQRCTNTRRLIVHKSQYELVVEGLQVRIGDFVSSGEIANPLEGGTNDYGYGPLIDANSFGRFEQAKLQAREEGGSVWGGERVVTPHEGAYYVTPALALMPKQTAVMQEETFAPILFITTYDGPFSDALTMLNAPKNSGLVAGLYSLSKTEVSQFETGADAGHVLINAPKGTGTPAHGMGFGGNKDSGMGEILNGADPLQPFTRPGHYRRIARNADIVLTKD